MKNKLLLCSLALAGMQVVSQLSAQNTWTQKADFGGTARTSAIGFSIANKGYIGTGYDGAYRNDFWEWDHATNVWTQKANFGGGRRWAAVGFSIGTKGYVGTGKDGAGAYKQDFWQYDPTTNVWTQKANFGGTPRNLAVGFSIGAKGYIGTGMDGAEKKDFWEYDPTINSWTKKSDFGGTARYYAAGFSIGTNGYIGTGLNATTNKQDFWSFNPSSNTWTQRANFGGTARWGAVGFSLNAKGCIGTGHDNNFTQDFWEYDPASDLWTLNPNFGGTARESAVGFSIGNFGYIGTGQDGPSTSYKSDFWEYGSHCFFMVTSQTNVSCGQCNGTASVNPSGGTSPYTYSWNTTPIQTTQTATGLCAGNYVVTVTDAAGCTGTQNVTITQSSTLTCSTDTTPNNNSATVYVSGGITPYTYSWSTVPVQTTSTATGLVSGSTYTVVVADASGCTCLSVVTVGASLSCNVSLYIFQDSSNTLKWHVHPTVTGKAPFSYLWDFGDGNTSTQHSPLHTYAVAGHYNICVTITDATGCISTICDSTYRLMGGGIIKYLVVDSTTTGIEENPVFVNSVFPNPSNDRVEISFSDFVKGELRITDITGREVYSEKINANNVRVNVSTLPAGFYNLTIASGAKTMREKIMIAR